MPAKALSNVVVTYNSTNITAYLNKGSLKNIVNAIDTTNLASTAQEFTPGAVGYELPVGGMWMQALHTAVGADAASPPTTLRSLVVQIGPSGNRVTYTWTGSATVGAFVTDYEVDFSDPLGMIVWSGTLKISGAPTIT